jgi:RNAse (barnase) inhibitor barstar
MSRVKQVEISLVGISTSAQLHKVLAESLGFPIFYGCNWDAFWDIITDLIEMPLLIRFIGWSEFETVLPGEASMLMRCLEEQNETNPTASARIVFA